MENYFDEQSRLRVFRASLEALPADVARLVAAALNLRADLNLKRAQQSFSAMGECDLSYLRNVRQRRPNARR